jgi:hypothetical protein
VAPDLWGTGQPESIEVWPDDGWEQGAHDVADLVGVPGADEADGGPPTAARYITRHSHPYRLPSMELECLIYEYDAFRSYLQGALGG